MYRRYRGDMIEVFINLRGTYSVRPHELLPRAPATALRGRDYRLLKRLLFACQVVILLLSCGNLVE